MASTKEYLDYVLERLSGMEEVSFRPMMGEYVIYYQGKVIGGVYDDRFLLKQTKAARQIMSDAGLAVQTDIPYPGANEMIVADVDDGELTCRVIRAMAQELPAPKRGK